MTPREQELLQTVDELRIENALLRQKIDLVKRVFGSSSEQLDKNQLELLAQPETSATVEAIVATPENLLEILRVGHFANVGICLDVGHAHLVSSVTEAFELLDPRIKELHLHDNHALEGGLGDEHLWPGSGSIDFTALGAAMKSLAPETAGMFEIAYDTENPADIPTRFRSAQELLA